MTLRKFIEHIKHNSVRIALIDPEDSVLFNGTVGIIKNWFKFDYYENILISMIIPYEDKLKIFLGDEEEDAL